MTIQGLIESVLSGVPDGMSPADAFSGVELYIGGQKVEFVEIKPFDGDTTEPAKIMLELV